MPVTVAAALPLIGDRWQIGRWQIDPLRLAFAQTASFAGYALVFAAFLHVETEYRRTPFRLAAEAHAPAIVLIDDLERRFTPSQHQPYDIHSKDYTRNGLGPLGPIIMGRDLGNARTALLCQQMPDRAVYRVQLDQEHPTGTIMPVCNGATPP